VSVKVIEVCDNDGHRQRYRQHSSDNTQLTVRFFGDLSRQKYDAITGQLVVRLLADLERLLMCLLDSCSRRTAMDFFLTHPSLSVARKRVPQNRRLGSTR